MTTDSSRVTVHMVASLDGFIAKKDNSVAWFETPDYYEKGVAGQDAEEFLKTIDCYVMGARTYEHAVELSKLYGWPYGNTPVIVVTHSDLPADRKNIEFYSGDLDPLLNKQLRQNYKHIWIAGGAILSRDIIRLKLADEIRLTIIPIILGEGTPFFDSSGQEQALHLKDLTGYKNGMVELCYEIKKQ